jgi:hypothetical protein
MGYRSSVAGVISVDSPSALGIDLKFGDADYADRGARLIGMIKLSDFYTYMITEHPNEMGWDIKIGVFMFHADYWKWYVEYSVVKAWQVLWENMRQLEGVSGYFARVGEDAKDIVEEEFGDDPCYDYFTPCSHLNVEDRLLGQRG